MAGNITAGGVGSGTGGSFGEDFAGRLAQISSRTSLMAIDAILRLAPAGPADPFPVCEAADAVAEVRSVARRMLQATCDFRATVQQPAE